MGQQARPPGVDDIVMKEGRHERGLGLFLKELNMDSLNRRLESYCLQTTEALAY